MICTMATIHISEIELTRSAADLMNRVRAGAEISIDDARGYTFARVIPAPSSPRTIEQALALLPESPQGYVDDEFAAAVEAAIAENRQPLDASVWD